MKNKLLLSLLISFLFINVHATKYKYVYCGKSNENSLSYILINDAPVDLTFNTEKEIIYFTIDNQVFLYGIINVEKDNNGDLIANTVNEQGEDVKFHVSNIAVIVKEGDFIFIITDYHKSDW